MRGLDAPLLEVVLDMEGGLTSIRQRLGSWRKVGCPPGLLASNASGLIIPQVIMCVIVHSSQGHLLTSKDSTREMKSMLIGTNDFSRP